jgi:hypothetical protein
MAAGKYIDIVSGVLTQKVSVESSAGAADEGKLVSLNASGQIDSTMLDGAYTANVTAGNTVALGDMCYIAAAGTISTALATAIGTIAQGFATEAGTAGTPATIVFGGGDTNVAGLTPGVEYYLDPTTPGAITATPPSTPTQVIQPVGFAVTATRLHFNRQPATVVV